DAFEIAVRDGVILDVHRKALGLGIERRALRHRPREQDAVVFEPEVVVQVAREMFLDAEKAIASRFRFDLPLGFRGLLEVALAAVFLESHPAILPSRAGPPGGASA